MANATIKSRFFNSSVLQDGLSGIDPNDTIAKTKFINRTLKNETYEIDFRDIDLNPEIVTEIPNPVQPANDRRCCCTVICDLFRRIFS